MEQHSVIAATVTFVKEQLKGEEAGHDWLHIERVWNTAKKIADKEKANMLIVELGALLHDIAEAKFHNGDESTGPKTARTFLEMQPVDEDTIHAVEQIIKHISFKGSFKEQQYKTIELDIVQDADRLDAIGAIGIARAFNYGGFKNRRLYDPEVSHAKFESAEQYKKNEGPTINHFYEKLFLLKDLMNTATGQELAAERHHFMEAFVDQFYKECSGER